MFGLTLTNCSAEDMCAREWDDNDPTLAGSTNPTIIKVTASVAWLKNTAVKLWHHNRVHDDRSSLFALVQEHISEGSNSGQ